MKPELKWLQQVLLSTNGWTNREQPNDKGDSKAIESHQAKVARYNRCKCQRLVTRISGISTFWWRPTGLWWRGRHHPNFEDWHMNHEIALLIVTKIVFHRNECSWTQYYTKRTNEGINQTNSKQINPLRSSESQTKTIPESSHWLYFFLRHSRSSTKPCRSLILLYVKRTRQVRLVRYLVNSPKSLSISHRVHKLPWNCHHPEMQYSYHSLTSTIENTLIAA